MKHFIACTLVMHALYGCGAVSKREVFEPTWSQRAEEAGRLSVGRVTAVSETGSRDTSPLSEPAAAGRLAGASVKPSGSLVVRNGLSTFRHTVILKAGANAEFVLEYKFNVGDCVAVRPRTAETSALLVTALPGQCD